jgi:hypothetical protein
VRVLADDWIIDMPGVSAPGSYEEYAKDPWKYEKNVVDKAVAGTYEYYYPRTGAQKAGAQ